MPAQPAYERVPRIPAAARGRRLRLRWEPIGAGCRRLACVKRTLRPALAPGQVLPAARTSPVRVKTSMDMRWWAP